MGAAICRTERILTNIRQAMKFLSSQLGFLLTEGETRENLAALLKYFAFLVVMITVYAVLFHVIMGRITHERNVEAIHRAGADFVLSYTSLGVDSVMSLVNGAATVMLGEGVRLFEVPVPPSLAGQPLSQTGIGSRTGLSVVAMEDQQTLTTQLTGETLLPGRGTLVMLGNADQRQQFADAFEKPGR
jgi:hypothetical protein